MDICQIILANLTVASKNQVLGLIAQWKKHYAMPAVFIAGFQ